MILDLYLVWIIYERALKVISFNFMSVWNNSFFRTLDKHAVLLYGKLYKREMANNEQPFYQVISGLRVFTCASNFHELEGWTKFIMKTNMLEPKYILVQIRSSGEYAGNSLVGVNNYFFCTKSQKNIPPKGL